MKYRQLIAAFIDPFVVHVQTTLSLYKEFLCLDLGMLLVCYIESNEKMRGFKSSHDK